MFIYLGEWNLIITDAAPPGVPSVNDQCGNLSIVCEQLSQLILDQLNLLPGYNVRPNICTEVENREIQTDLEPMFSERLGVLTNDVVLE